jgi:peptide chain release factor subunit 1
MPTTSLAAQLDRLAALEPGPFPVISLYLNAQPDQNGRDHFEPFLRKELPERLRTYGAEGPELDSLEKDAAKIREYLGAPSASANGIALFACSGADVFEVIELAAPIREHRLYVSAQPHLYPLARLLDEYPRYAVLVADTNLARLFVVATNTVQATEQVAGTKTRRHKMGGWSQARYQRHIENYHQQHAKEVVDMLARVVRDEGITAIIIAGDEVAVPLLREHLPKDIAERVVDVLKLDMHAPEREILETTIETMRQKDAETDRARVEAVLGAYRGDGLGVVGVEATLAALELGQVDELVITAVPETIDATSVQPKPTATSDSAVTPGPAAAPSAEERLADQLVAKARQTAAKIRFIQDPALLAAVGGVGAFLRYKL